MALKKREPYLGLEAGDLLAAQKTNKYVAVLAAARMARRLNDTKVADYESSPEADRTLEAHKVTSMALEMLLKNEIEFKPLAAVPQAPTT
jgi:hypothetical protein